MVLALLIITACWMLILSLVLAICLSARQGDRQQLKQAHPMSERNEALRPRPTRLPIPE